MYDSVFYALHSRRNEFFPTGKKSQFRQGRRALAHGQLRSEHVDEIEQGQQGSSRAKAVFCRFPSPVGREAVEDDHLGCAVTDVLEERFAWAWRLAAAVAK
jgi:hypothetical protein